MSNVNLIFEALSSNPRRRILNYLSSTSLTASEIANRFDMSKPALSKHLKTLETAGLVQSERKGQYVYYSLNRDSLVNNLYDFIANFCPEGLPLKRESKAISLSKQKSNKKKKT